MSHRVTILIPVYNAVETANQCLLSLLESDACSAPIMMLDDGSNADESARLAEISADYENVKLVSHLRNRGYTWNVSLGLEQVNTEFVCILNSDTRLPSKWIDKIIQQFDSNKWLHGIGPLSNAASYQSVPELRDEDGFSTNDQLGEAPDERDLVNLILAWQFSSELVDAPILNGFCTVFRTATLQAVGGFDVQAFPDGYGEENDLCMKLRASGHRLAIALDSFVFHEKSISFGNSRRMELSQKGREVLNELYGEPQLRGVVDTLEALEELTLVRYLVKALMPMLENRSFVARDLQGTVTNLDASQLNAFRVQGAALLRITSESISVTDESHGSANFCFEYKASELLVQVPAKEELTFFAEARFASVLVALAFKSRTKAVTLKGWHPEVDTFDRDLPGFPLDIFKNLFYVGNA